MIEIGLPKNNMSERKYIIDIFFNEFLGLDYKITYYKDYQDWVIKLENNSQIIIKDHFFNRFENNLQYLNLNHIPAMVSFAKNAFLAQDNIPILYGDSLLHISEKSIICGIDIFASSFFMLTRWEEFVNKTRDEHDRFPASASLAYKNNFLFRPIVNEYICMFKSMLKSLDINLKFKEYIPRQFISCDVDQPFDHTVLNLRILARTCLGDLLKRRNIKEFFYRIRRFVYNKARNYKFDKNYSFYWYMDTCEKIGLRIAFYIIPDNMEKNNGHYDLENKDIQGLLKFIDSRGHEIGMHASYQTYQNKTKMKMQKDMLDNSLKELNISQVVIGNRQHYLRWDSSVTPRILDDLNFYYDTSGAYADSVGFRYGICYEFSMYDFISRKKLNLKQRPLIVMECSLLDKKYMGLSYEEGFKFVKNLKDSCFLYGGCFTLLWHNSSFYSSLDKQLFQKIITYGIK